MWRLVLIGLHVYIIVIRPIRRTDAVGLSVVKEGKRRSSRVVCRHSPSLNLENFHVKTSGYMQPLPGNKGSNFFIRGSNPYAKAIAEMSPP